MCLIAELLKKQQINKNEEPQGKSVEEIMSLEYLETWGDLWESKATEEVIKLDPKPEPSKAFFTKRKYWEC